MWDWDVECLDPRFSLDHTALLGDTLYNNTSLLLLLMSWGSFLTFQSALCYLLQYKGSHKLNQNCKVL